MTTAADDFSTIAMGTAPRFSSGQSGVWQAQTANQRMGVVAGGGVRRISGVALERGVVSKRGVLR